MRANLRKEVLGDFLFDSDNSVDKSETSSDYSEELSKTIDTSALDLILEGFPLEDEDMKPIFSQILTVCAYADKARHNKKQWSSSPYEDDMREALYSFIVNELDEFRDFYKKLLPYVESYYKKNQLFDGQIDVLILCIDESFEEIIERAKDGGYSPDELLYNYIDKIIEFLLPFFSSLYPGVTNEKIQVATSGDIVRVSQEINGFQYLFDEEEIVQALCQAEPTEDGNTFLHLAINEMDLEALRDFVENIPGDRKGYLSQTNNDNYTALDFVYDEPDKKALLESYLFTCHVNLNHPYDMGTENSSSKCPYLFFHESQLDNEKKWVSLPIRNGHKEISKDRKMKISNYAYSMSTK